tara:strand:- start:2679 stop:5078 length:2400 start_codon:yes stop_codon:yes gene_type:complete
MKNKIITIFFSIFFFKNAFAENISIEAKNISFDKDNNITIFENEVVVKTQNSIIKSDFAKHVKKDGLLILQKNIVILDKKNNKLLTEYAEYYEKDKIFKTKGETTIKTINNYILTGKNFFVDDTNKIISSNQKSYLEDQDKNKIYFENFQYLSEKNLFKSIGLIEIIDAKKNKYKFSQIYIDTKKKEVLGTDSKTFLNDENFKINKKNDPRIFSNTTKITKAKSSFSKSIFTLCQYRENDSCPPWAIKSKKMIHDNLKKTIYYENAVVKVYNLPIFYFPRLSHPDPTVDRRSGFLPPTLSDSKNLGSGVSIPYFFDFGKDKNFTFTNRMYYTEHPLFLGEYHQAFKNSNLLTDFGYTEGYKKTNTTKKGGDKSHFFGKFVKNYKDKKGFENTLDLTVQEVSNDKYLKLYKIKSNLVDFNQDTLENSFEFTQEREDLFFGLNGSIYETMKDDYEDKYEYNLPEITLDKNLFFNEKLGNLELQTNYKAHKYDTNKFTSFFINDLNLTSNDINFDNGISSKILANIKNINYESKNVDIYKDDPVYEIYNSLGILSEINFIKDTGISKHLFKPKWFVRYSPGSMRQDLEGSRLNPLNAFNLNKVSNINNYETGLNGTIGLDYKIKDNNNKTNFDFSLAQVISEKENKKMNDKSSLNEKLSDLVGKSTFKFNDNLNFNYEFAIDQNYNDLNYSEFGSEYNNNKLKIGFNYLNERKHIGNQDYFKSELSLKNKDKGLLSFKTKRNLTTDSSEFYDLSYEYINDCLRAGLVYRREFYNDTELEPEDSLMFKLTLVPFGNLDSPKFD